MRKLLPYLLALIPCTAFALWGSFGGFGAGPASAGPSGPVYGYPEQPERLATVLLYEATNITYASDSSYYAFTNTPGSTGTYSTASVLVYTNGISAYHYLPGSGYIESPDADHLSFGDATSDQPFSYSFWGNMTDATGFRAMIKGDDNSVRETYFGTDASDKLLAACNDLTSANQIKFTSTATETGSQGTWNHYIFTYDGSGNNTGITIYKNGATVAGTAATDGSYTAMHNTTSAFYIGTLNAGGFFANGNMDDERIYSSEMTANDASNLFWQTCWANPSNYPVDGQAAIPGGHGWNKWEYVNRDGARTSAVHLANGDTAFVAGGNIQCNVGNRGVNGAGGAAVTQGTSLTNGTFSFDGGDDYDTAGNLSSISGSANRTFAFWAKRDDNLSAQNIMGHGAWTAQQGWDINVGSNYVGVNVRTYYRYWDLNDNDTNEWHHYAFVLDGTDCSDITAYQDGVELSQRSINDTTINTAAAVLTVGKGKSAVANYTGELDFIAVFSTALTSNVVYDMAVNYNEGGNQ